MKTALLVIDVQNFYTDPDSDTYCQTHAETIQKINRLIQHFEKTDQPIFLIRHQHTPNGSDAGRMFDFAENGQPVEEIGLVADTDEVAYADDLYQPKTATHVTKTRYSCFPKTHLEAKLRSLDVHKIAICGFMTNFCCESTARDAHSRDFYVDFIIDATGTPGTDSFDENQVRQATAENISNGFGVIYILKDYI